MNSRTILQITTLVMIRLQAKWVLNCGIPTQRNGHAWACPLLST